ncbi:MAG: aminofutalosine synthase MqnE [Candidatus Omnitrophica bacterium]|nr:aminofutalosine synthase MqnE [Candidatus Omnitrophota bacterium]
MLNQIEAKIRNGERIDEEEALYLLRHPDLNRIGRLANDMRESMWGRRCTYNINRHIHPTNVCVFRCTFCSFYRRPGQDGGYLVSPEEAVERAKALSDLGITELHMVGGCHPTAKTDYYCSLYRAIKEELTHIHIKSLTAVEVAWLARVSKQSFEEVLVRLKEAGLDSLPGGGAEIFAQRVRDLTCGGKCDAEEWLEVHRVAHRIGIPTNSTMLYGHIETDEEIVDHLSQLRKLQDETGGFMTFIPLAYHPENNVMEIEEGPSGQRSLQVFAVSRLFLDNIPHLKAYWVMLGLEIAQMALWYGADDLDGTVVDEHIYHDAGAITPDVLTVSDLRKLIAEAERDPIERDTLYRPIVRDEATGQILEIGKETIAS